MKRLCWVLAVLLSHWRRHPMQLATLVVGLIAATALWSGVQAINAQARQSYDRAAAAFGGGNTAMLVASDGGMFSQDLFAALRRAGWPVSPVLEGRIVVNNVNLRLIGIEPITLPREAGPGPRFGSGDLAAFLLPPGRTLVSAATLRELNLAENATPSIGEIGALPPLKVVNDLVDNLAVVDIGAAQRLLQRQGQLSRLLVGPDSGLRAPLAEIAGRQLNFVAAGSESDLDRLTQSFHTNLTAFGLLSFVVGLFIVHSAIGLAFEQRLPTMRTLRACGISAAGLTAALLVELVSLALIAGFIGCAGGYLIAALLLPDVAVSLRGLYGAQVPGQLTLEPIWWLASIGMSVFGALAAAGYSLAKVSRLPLLATAHPYAWRAVQQRWLTWQGVVAVFILLSSLVILRFGDGLITGFALLATIMIGAALGLPIILGTWLSFAERLARSATAKWFWADSRQQLSGLSLALMALLLALAVNIGVGTMVRSFSQTFAGWLDQRLGAEIYFNATSDAQAAKMLEGLRGNPDVLAILPTPRADAQIGGWPVEVLGFSDHPTYRDSWPLLEARPHVWADIASGKAALVSEQLARRLSLSPGAELRVSTPQGELRLTVGGIYPDYGNAKGQIGLANDVLFAHWPQTPHVRYGLRVKKGAVPALVAQLRRETGLPPNRLIDQGALKAESLQIFNKTFAVTASLNAFTLGVAGIALLTSLLTLGNSRLPQLAPLWAIGLPRRSLAVLELVKTMALALFTSLIAVPLGLVVAWCLLAVVNVKAFGWRLPFHVFPDQIVRLIVVAMIAALLAALLPIIKLARQRPADLMRVFSNER